MPRSSFVSGLAWTFIVLGAFATLIALLQNIMIGLMFPVEEMRAALREAQKTAPVPAFVGVMLEHLRLVFAAFFALCLATLAASIGLLKRKNWARVAFIWLMVIGALSNLAGAVVPFFMFSSLTAIPQNAPGELREGFQLMAGIMTGFMVVAGIVFAALFAWVAKRLASNEIKREFLY